MNYELWLDLSRNRRAYKLNPDIMPNVNLYHSVAVVRSCCKGNVASQWEIAIFGYLKEALKPLNRLS